MSSTGDRFKINCFLFKLTQFFQISTSDRSFMNKCIESIRTQVLLLTTSANLMPFIMNKESVRFTRTFMQQAIFLSTYVTLLNFPQYFYIISSLFQKIRN